MIRFVYGESGHGKTHKLIDMIEKDASMDIHSFLIVPEQYAVASERLILDNISPSAQLNVEVLGFSRLYNRVCREYGGLEYNYITTPAKHLLMWKTLHDISDMLEYYPSGDTATEASFVDFMLRTVSELKSNGITPEMLEISENDYGESDLLYEKLKDIALVYSVYCSAVSEKFSDSSDDISKLTAILEEHDFFHNCNVYIDSFTSFTSPEHKVIEKIFRQAANTTITIPLPAPRYSSIYTESISASERSLIKNANLHGGYSSYSLKENKRAKFPALEFIGENIWDLGASTFEDHEVSDTSVCLEMCDTPYAEAEAAARWSLELMRSGTRCRDIVVITRDAEKYRGIIEPAFERNGIPFFFSEKTDLCSKPSVKLILSALRIKNNGWQASDVISHVKTQAYDISQDYADMFESYVNTWNIKGNRFLGNEWTMNPDGYSSAMTERGERILRAANEVREAITSHLLPLFKKLDNALCVADMCRAIYEYLVDCKIEQRMLELSAKSASDGNLKEAEEFSALYRITLDTLALVANTIGESRISSTELANILKLIFETTEIGTIPTSVDEITIGSASMIRANNPKCVIALGLREGEFPKALSDTGFLNSEERIRLLNYGLEISPEDTKASDELLFVKKTFSLPSEKLVLISSLTESDGRGCQPSLPYLRVKKLLPNIKEHRFDESDVGYLTCSPKTAASYMFMQKSNTDRYTLHRALCSISDEFSYLEAFSPAKLSTDLCNISEDNAKQLFPQRMKLSQSAIEKYVRCSFSYYCSYVLGLREEKRAEFNAIDIGLFIHFVLENMMKNIFSENEIKVLDNNWLEEMTEKTVNEYISSVCPEYEKSSKRLLHLYERLKRLSVLLVRNIYDEFSRSEFLPEHFELKINGQGDAPKPMEFKLKDGSTVYMSGVIDRVDVLRRDGKLYIRIVDYKTGSKDFSLDDLRLGLNMQMLIYLFTLCQSSANRFFGRIGESEDAPTPAGIIYLSSNAPIVELEDFTAKDIVMKEVAKTLSRNGLLLDDEEILKAMNRDLSSEFLPGVKYGKDGNIVGKMLMSSEGFSALRTEIETTISKIAEEMKSGKADASPLIYKGTSPCDYCEMRPICKILSAQ